VKRLVERARALKTIRAFFDARGFLEVETPLLVPSPGLDLHLDAFELGALGRDHGGDDPPARYLITSPEYQMKRLLADGHTRIFQIAKCFRRGELGARHNPEFTMLEWYRANAGVRDVMADTEQLVAAVTGASVVVGGVRFDASPPFARMTVCDAYRLFAGMSRAETLEAAAHDQDRFFRVMVDEVEPAIARLPHALFLTEYPSTQASLARKKPGDPEVAERFELYLAGVELCNGFGELVDAAEQRARLEHDQTERRRLGLSSTPSMRSFSRRSSAGYRRAAATRSVSIA
jgi:lysyl-tRNA synthetase class 2